MACVIELRDIEKTYRTGRANMVALDGIDLSIEKGEFTAIMGPSGSGKSTLMHIVGLLDKPTNGVYFFEGTDVSRIGKRRQAQIRNQRIGFVFQQFNLLSRAGVLDNVLLPTIYGPVRKPVERAKELVDAVGLKSRIRNRSNELSGGEIQRVAIARALIMDPNIILADEPTGNLDSKTSQEILGLLRSINEDGATVILITHDQEVARYADRVVNIRDGRLISDDTGEGSQHA